LMYVGPRCSKALRSRRERPARETSRRPSLLAWRRSTACQAKMAQPKRSPVTTTRRPGGMRRRLSSLGTSMAVSVRKAPTWSRQGSGLSVRSQGGDSLKAPRARSAGSSSSGAVMAIRVSPPTLAPGEHFTGPVRHELPGLSRAN
jgi:hypothetical protein